jgi:hypothetical protein
MSYNVFTSFHFASTPPIPENDKKSIDIVDIYASSSSPIGGGWEGAFH